jgi:hypothetical protein
LKLTAHILLILLLFAGSHACAQNNTATDSAIVSSPSVDSGLNNNVDSIVGTLTDEETGEKIYVDSSFNGNLRPITADTLSLIKKDKGFYYQHWLDSLLKARQGEVQVVRKPKEVDISFLNGLFNVFSIALWILAAALLVFIVYKLFLGNSPLFVKNRKNIDVVMVEEAPTTSSQYDVLIKKAINEQNYRLAIRYLHLQTLVKLADKNLVKTGTEKTNYQYLSELRQANTQLAQTFTGLTHTYEYIWYGEYQITEANYVSLANSFLMFNRSLD